MADPNFKPGDLIFAKMKGYSPWPAKVVSRIRNRKSESFKVKFFGTHNITILQNAAFLPYDSTTKIKFGNHRAHRPSWNNALDEIEAASIAAARRTSLVQKNLTPLLDGKRKSTPETKLEKKDDYRLLRRAYACGETGIDGMPGNVEMKMYAVSETGIISEKGQDLLLINKDGTEATIKMSEFVCESEVNEQIQVDSIQFDLKVQIMKPRYNSPPRTRARSRILNGK